MSFGSPTPVEVAVQGVSLQDDYAYAQKVQCAAGQAGLPARSAIRAGDTTIPTLDINIDRDRAGQFGLTMADVVRSVVPATSSSRFTEPNYWRDPNSGNAFQIQVELPQNRMQSVDAGRQPAGDARRPLRAAADDIAALKLGTMPGLIERYNGQHIVSLTANIHGITLGEAARKLNQALAGAGAPPRGVTVRHARRDSAAGADHLRPAHRPAAGRAGDLPAARREFPVAAAGAGDRPDRSRGAVRRAADAAGHRHHAEHSVLHGRDHGDRHCRGQLDSAGHLRRALRGTRAGRCWMPRAKAPPAACARS